ATGRSFFDSFVNWNRNGSWTAKLAMPACSVGGDFWIVSCRHFAQALNASKVLAILPKTAALIWATGATSAEARPMFLKKSVRCVFGFERVCITGVRCLKNGLNAAIASLIDAPRPAKASPKPLSAVRELFL